MKRRQANILDPPQGDILLGFSLLFSLFQNSVILDTLHTLVRLFLFTKAWGAKKIK